LKIRSIYFPTFDTKTSIYGADPLKPLYTDLPRKFGFKKPVQLPKELVDTGGTFLLAETLRK
jgi:hypothetical protein